MTEQVTTLITEGGLTLATAGLVYTAALTALLARTPARRRDARPAGVNAGGGHLVVG